MKREEKSQVVESLKRDFAESKASFLVSYKGLTVSALEDLRRKLRAEGASFRVAKARLIKLATKNMQHSEPLESYCKEQVGLIFANKEVSPVAKMLTTFAKENAKLGIVVGCSIDQGLLDGKAIVTLASLPSREVLLAQLCGVLKAPLSSFARVIQLVQTQKQ